jgi:hypothetical protein
MNKNLIKAIPILSFVLLFSNTNIIGQIITYNDLNTWINASDYPGKMFSELESKGFVYDGTSTIGGELNCKYIDYDYNLEKEDFCRLMVEFCKYQFYLKDRTFDIARRINIFWVKKGKTVYDQLTYSIKNNCTLVESTVKKYYDSDYTEYIYINNKGIYYVFYSRFDPDYPGMVYDLRIVKVK